ncbi:MAG: acyl carrier protein [Kiritimatiellaeota bacterium]|nr:acyl carrier protein [Kiritimatiellota bacterium]
MREKSLEETIVDVLERDFEIPKEKLLPDAALFSDLELDSLDIVDLIVALEKAFDIKIRTEAAQAFRDVRTLGDLYAAVRKMRDDFKDADSSIQGS